MSSVQSDYSERGIDVVDVGFHNDGYKENGFIEETEIAMDKRRYDKLHIEYI